MPIREIGEFTKEWFFLSNFFPAAFDAYGRTWPTTEHFFQAMKSVDETFRDKMAKAATPGASKRMGRTAALRPDWNEVRDEVMLVAVRHKFRLVQGLDRMLLSTGGALLVEGNRHGDATWGFDLDRGYGENRLGLILMRVRDELADPAAARVQFYGPHRTFVGQALWKNKKLAPTRTPDIVRMIDLRALAGDVAWTNALVMPDNGDAPVWLTA